MTQEEFDNALVTDLQSCDKEHLYMTFHALLKGKKVLNKATNYKLSKHIPFWAVKRNREALIDIVCNRHEKYLVV